MKGIGCWSLGQETEEVWKKYSTFLENNEEKYMDLENVNFANDAIEFVKEKGWIKGRSENIFAPNEYLTRGEAATIIARVLNLDIIDGYETLYADTNYHWAKTSINVLTKTGLMEGYPDKTFKPDTFIKREEIAKILSLLKYNYKRDEEVTFNDVDINRWSYKYIMDLAKKGILVGYEDGNFKPENNITRAEIAVILERMYK